MTIVFIHGVPETGHSWRKVIAALDRENEMIALDLPGFASPADPGFIGSKENYLAWLLSEFETIHAKSGPFHAVGHDWGFMLLLRAASLRPELFRSVAGGGGTIDPHLPLHSFWRAFAKPVFGEEVMEKLLTPETIEKTLANAGHDAQDIRRCAWFTPGNKRLTLDLYRSGVTIGQEWAQDLPRIVVPSKLIWGFRDLMVPPEVGRRLAAKIGSEFVLLDSAHFWLHEKPAEAAAELMALWARAEVLPYNLVTDPDIVLP